MDHLIFVTPNSLSVSRTESPLRKIAKLELRFQKNRVLSVVAKYLVNARVLLVLFTRVGRRWACDEENGR